MLARESPCPRGCSQTEHASSIDPLSVDISRAVDVCDLRHEVRKDVRQ